MAAAPVLPVEAAGTQAQDLGGVVRSYNGSKGFGFITGEGPYNDVMFSRHELPEDAREVRGKFLEGRHVVFDANIAQDGRAKATRLSIPSSEGVFLPGMVKSYSEKNGYGFLSSSSIPNEDIRFSKSDFPPLVPGANMKGALVIFQKQQQADGKLRVIKIQFQTARIAEKFKCVGMEGYAVVPFQQPTLGSGALTGVVKSFGEKNGYGFIRIPGQIADIMFGKSDVQGGSITPGTPVSFMLAMSQDGRVRAKQVVATGIVPNSTGGGKGGSGAGGQLALKGSNGKRTGLAALAEPTGQRLVGSIKSFNAWKGFGFISTANVPGDVFFLKSSLPAEAHSMELPGREVEYDLMRAPDGNLRAQGVRLLGF